MTTDCDPPVFEGEAAAITPILLNIREQITFGTVPFHLTSRCSSMIDINANDISRLSHPTLVTSNLSKQSKNILFIDSFPPSVETASMRYRNDTIRGDGGDPPMDEGRLFVLLSPRDARFIPTARFGDAKAGEAPMDAVTRAGEAPIDLTRAGEAPRDVVTRAEEAPMDVVTRAGEAPRDVVTLAGEAPRDVVTRAGEAPMEVVTLAGDGDATRAGDTVATDGVRADIAGIRVILGDEIDTSGRSTRGDGRRTGKI